MATGTWTLAWLLLTVGAAPTDVVYMNQRNIRLPFNVKSERRQDMKELTLFSSTDEGKTWQQVAVANPDQDGFPFYAPTDGQFWFTISCLTQQGKHEPEDIYQHPPSQKILIDTLKPVVKIVSAERQGDDIQVSWEIQEEHPDLATLKLEYRTPDAPLNLWYTAPVGAPALNGQTRFRLANPAQVSLRLQFQDLANNQGLATYEVPAAPATNNVVVSAEKPAAPSSAPAAPAQPLPVPAISSWDNARTTPAPVPSPYESRRVQEVPAQPSNVAPPYGNPQDPSSRVVAYSSPPAAPAYAYPGPGRMPLRPLPPLQVINTPQITLEYEVTKVGPSALGKVELWVTQDDGKSWRFLADDPDLKSPIIADLPGEGTYGFCLVLHSGAGLTRGAPLAGDAPEIRVEVDTTPPVAQLYRPEPDPQVRDALLISWTATDKNLAQNPISLQWADRADGNWQHIANNLPNTGRYTWQLPANLPYRVYLRLIARDNAGNISTAQTPDSVLVDLNKPEGKLVGIVGRRP